MIDIVDIKSIFNVQEYNGLLIGFLVTIGVEGFFLIMTQGKRTL